MGKWIPVSELPAKEGWHIVFAGNGKINPGIAYWDNSYKEFQINTAYGYKHIDIDYWMPLPEPPEDE